MTFLLKRIAEWRRLSRFPAKMTFANARALLRIEIEINSLLFLGRRRGVQKNIGVSLNS